MKLINKIKRSEFNIDAPASKAHTLRAIIIGALAEGQTIIHNPLFGDDQINVIRSLQGLGIKIEIKDNKVIVYGNSGKFSPAINELNVGESGVGMNFLTSVACLSDKPIVITGTGRLNERPIAEVGSGLLQLGCKLEYLNKEGFPPVKVCGLGIKGGKASIKGSFSSQYFSSITIAAPYSENDVILNCIDNMNEKPYFDITTQMMGEFGVKVDNKNYKEILIPCKQKYKAQEIKIEGDYSSAAFFFLLAAISKSQITVQGLRLDTVQGDRKFLLLLKNMGCTVDEQEKEICVTGNKLNAIEADMGDIPDLVPAIAVAAAFAEGTSKFTNIAHLRFKECDRIGVMISELNKMGVMASCDENTLTITGEKKIHGAAINPYNDHRIAMSFAMAGLVTGEQIINDETCVKKSFPDFWDKFQVFVD